MANRRRFKEMLSCPPNASDCEENDIDAGTNWGHKMQRGAGLVSCRRFVLDGQGVGVRLVEYQGRKKAMIYKRARKYNEIQDDNEQKGDSDNECDDSNEEELLDAQQLGQLLSPISDPREVPDHPAISRPYKSRILSAMAKEISNIIVEEKSRITKFANLFSIFLGDDSGVLKVENLGIPEYCGVPESKQEEEEDDNPSVQYVEASSQVTKPDGISFASAQSSMDAFFAVPILKIDRNFGVSNEAAEETRQLLQIAHQRMEEYVRCMTVIYSGLSRADRLRRKVLNWCKEMRGDDWVLDEIGPDDWRTRWTSVPLDDEKTDGNQTETESERADA